jgi:hypothetical protein
VKIVSFHYTYVTSNFALRRAKLSSWDQNISPCRLPVCGDFRIKSCCRHIFPRKFGRDSRHCSCVMSQRMSWGAGWLFLTENALACRLNSACYIAWTQPDKFEVSYHKNCPEWKSVFNNGILIPSNMSLKLKPLNAGGSLKPQEVAFSIWKCYEHVKLKQQLNSQLY